MPNLVKADRLDARLFDCRFHRLLLMRLFPRLAILVPEDELVAVAAFAMRAGELDRVVAEDHVASLAALRYQDLNCASVVPEITYLEAGSFACAVVGILNY